MLSVCVLFGSIPPKLAPFAPLAPVAPRVGEESDGRSWIVETSPLGVQVSAEVASLVGVDARWNLEGVVMELVVILVGEGFGVDCLSGDGEAGLSGRRKGEDRGEP